MTTPVQDEFRAFLIASGYVPQYNDGLVKALQVATGSTLNNINDLQRLYYVTNGVKYI